MKYPNHFSFLTHNVYNSQKSPSEQKNNLIVVKT